MLRLFCCKLLVAIVSCFLGVGMSTTAHAAQNSYICAVERTYSAHKMIGDDELSTKWLDETANRCQVTIDINHRSLAGSSP